MCISALTLTVETTPFARPFSPASDPPIDSLPQDSDILPSTQSPECSLPNVDLLQIEYRMCTGCGQVHNKQAMDGCTTCDSFFCATCSCPCPVAENGFGWELELAD